MHHNAAEFKYRCYTSNFDIFTQVVSKLVGPVRQSDISSECPTKNVGVPDQMSDRNYKKNIHLMDEKKRNISDRIQYCRTTISLRFCVISLFL